MTTRPFGDLIALINQLPNSGYKSASNNGLVDSISGWISSTQQRPEPKLDEMHICVLASAYSAPEGLSSEQATEGHLDIDKFIASAGKGQAPVNRLCKVRGLGLRVLELAPSMPHRAGDHWAEAECVAAIAFGMEATAAGGDLLCLGSICHWDAHHANIVLEKIYNNQNERNLSEGDALYSVLEVLRVFGGRDIAASLGAMIAARSRQLPVIIEGWGAICAYAILQEIAPQCVDHIVLGAVQDEAQYEWSNHIGMNVPLVGFKIDEGPGCGVAHAATLVAASIS